MKINRFRWGLKLFTISTLAMLIALAVVPASMQEVHPLAGQSIDMSILGIGGWLPSSLGAEMANELFAPYAKEHYGYSVNFTFTGSPFDSLFQSAAASLATHSNEYNIIISDSQWLGALSTPGWIVDIDQLISKGIPEMGIAPQPGLNIAPFTPVVRNTYQVFPDGSDEIWGLPEEGDVQVLFVRKDLLLDPKERAAFESKYGRPLPQTFEDFEALTMTQFEDIAAFFTRPDKDLYGIVMQHSKGYDYMTMQLYPFMWSRGGEIWDSSTGQVWGVLNNQVNAEGLEWNRRMLNYGPPGALNIGISENVDWFVQGKAFSALQWAAVGLAMITDENRDNVMIVPPPAFEGTDGQLSRIYAMGGQPWVLNAYNTPEQMRVAVDFLNWWYLPETQLEFAHRGGNPTDATTLNNPEFDSINPWNPAYRYMLQEKRARDFWHEPNYSEMLALQQEAFTAYAAGETDDAMRVLEWVACQQQDILYSNGRSEIAPPPECDAIDDYLN